MRKNNMSKPSPPPQTMAITLPVAAYASHRLQTDDDTPLSTAMPVSEAINWLKDLARGGRTVSVITLAGPGDPLASWKNTEHCLARLAEVRNRAAVHLTTLGLAAMKTIPALVKAGVDQVNLQVDCGDEATAAAFYRWLRPGKKTLPLDQACPLLIKEQPQFCQACCEAGLQVVIQSRIIAGVNDRELAAVAKNMARLGARAMEIIGDKQVVSPVLEEVNAFLPCHRLDPAPPMPPPATSQSSPAGENLPQPQGKRQFVAVASHSGMDVDLHLGQAEKFLIYGRREDGLTCLLATRDAPVKGDARRWQTLAATLSDCFCLLASLAAEAPWEQLAEAGIRVLLTDDQIKGMVDRIFSSGRKKKCKQSIT